MTVDRITGLVVAGEMLAGELAQARAEVERLRDQVAQLETAMDAYGTIAVELDKVLAERDRLRAVLAETPENVAAVIASIEHPEAGLRDVVWDGRRILAALRARAGEPTR